MFDWLIAGMFILVNKRVKTTFNQARFVAFYFAFLFFSILLFDMWIINFIETDRMISAKATISVFVWLFEDQSIQVYLISVIIILNNCYNTYQWRKYMKTYCHDKRQIGECFVINSCRSIDSKIMEFKTGFNRRNL